MARLWAKRLFVFIGVLASLIIGSLFAYGGYLAICKPWRLHLALVDADVSARAWVDTNGNGYRDVDETPLEGVCVWDWSAQVPDDEVIAQVCDDPFHRTGDSGEWPSSEERYLTFRAGASCEDIYIFAKPPQGFEATTPIVVNSCYAEFGFAPEGSVSHSHSYDSFLQSERLAQRRQQIAIMLAVVTAVACSAVVSIRAVRVGREK